MKFKIALNIGLLILAITYNTGISQPNVSKNQKHHHRNYPLIRDTYKFPKFPDLRVPSNSIEINSVVKQDFFLTLRDNVQIDCSKFYPLSPNPFLPNGYPCVIMVHGYSDRKETLESFANSQAGYGYVVYTYSVRGQGNSGGLSNLISTIEAQDLIELVNFVRQDFQTGLDTANILITGGSQGGTLPYMAAAMGGLHVKTIISALSSPRFASSWIDNGCVKMTLLWSLEYPSDSVRYNPLLTAMRSWIYSSAPDKWDSIAYWMPINRNFDNIAAQNHIPMMIEDAWQDKFFNTKENININPYINFPKRYYLGAVRGHGGDYSPTEDTWHENFFNEWFYYWLFNIDNGILTRPRYHFAYSTFPSYQNMWSFVHDSSYVWPPNGIDNTVLYFRSGNSLLDTPGADQTDKFANAVNPTLTMQAAVDDEFTGTNFTSRFKKATITYNSPVLAQDIQMIGTPQIRFDYQSNATECQFNFQVYEVSGTAAKLVTRINYTDRYNTPNTRKNVIIDGISHGHIFKAGDKIRIVLTNLDTAPDDSAFLGTNPHVLPDLKNDTSTIYYSNNCFINIPYIGWGSRPVSIFQSNKRQNLLSTDRITGTIPSEFNLSQNYPNPFNPVTTINYSIPQNSFVRLKVYDVRGKEIATLVDNEVSPGYYSVKFNASAYGGLSSGIYFYKLSAGNYVNVKRLVLIK
jgi:predicted acyl esterase